MKKTVISIFLTIAICISCCLCSTFGATFPEYTITSDLIEINFNTQTPTSISKILYKDEKLYIADTQNNEIFIKDKNTTTLHSIGNKIPFDLSVYENYLIISSSNYYVHALNLSSTTPNLIDINTFIDENNNSEGLDSNAHRKIATSLNYTTYFIWDNTIATLEKQNEEFVLKHFASLSFEDSPLTFTNGAFFANESNTKLYFSIDTTIYVVDVATKTISKLDQTNFPSFSQIKNITADNLGNLYILDNQSLHKINSTSYAKIDFTNEILDIQYNLIDGNIFYSNSNSIYSASISDNFISSYKDFKNPVDLKTYTPKTTTATILEVISPTYLYPYKTLVQTDIAYNVGKRLILLDDSDELFYYVYDNNYNQNYTTGYIPKSACTPTQNAYPIEFTETQSARIIVGESKVYSLPTSLNIDQNNLAPYIGKLPYNSQITILLAPVYEKDCNNKEFVAITYTLNSQNYIGYIDKSTIINSTNETLINIKADNASTRAETSVFLEKDLLTKIDTLTKGSTFIILKTLDNGTTQIQYTTNEGPKTGYIKTSFVNDGSLSTTQILGKSLMVVSLITAITIAIIINKNKK